nr:PAX-interacting protein 1-like [Odocoileus virginianus texanus]
MERQEQGHSELLTGSSPSGRPAIKERKRCIMAHWLNMVLKKKLVPPHQVLYFPLAFLLGDKPCSQHIISMTGFVNSDRDDLKLMVYLAEWLEECFKCQKFIDKQNYLLRDAEAEVLFSFSLEESLRRAHVSPLFKAKYFYITPGICPSLSAMKAIVKCAGGEVLSKEPSIRKLMEHKQDKSSSEIILIACENDLHLCQEYSARGIDVHNAEFVLTGVLTQTLDYESYKFN